MTPDRDTTATSVDRPPLYHLQGVERRYMKGAAEVVALRDVNLDIAGGEFVCIEGPSGSGKSTLLQLLGALDTPTAGTIRMDGQELGSAGDGALTEIREHSASDSSSSSSTSSPP